MKSAAKTPSYSGLLGSILSYIKQQPEMMKALTKFSQISMKTVSSAIPVIDSDQDPTNYLPSQDFSQDNSSSF